MQKTNQNYFHFTQKTLALIVFFGVILLGIGVMFTILPYSYTVIERSTQHMPTVAAELPIIPLTSMFK